LAPTLADVALRNCQPFVRELGGLWHTFAHNSDLAGIEQDAHMTAETYRPVGETDSERAFCALFERLRPLWEAQTPPDVQARLRVIEPFAAESRHLGPANFLYCDGDALFAHADRRYQADGVIRPPGLWRLTRRCEAGGELSAEGLRIEAHGAEQEVTLFASVPLTAENWVPLARGEMVVTQAGRPPLACWMA